MPPVTSVTFLKTLGKSIIYFQDAHTFRADSLTFNDRLTYEVSAGRRDLPFNAGSEMWSEHAISQFPQCLIFFFFFVPVCAITASGVPGGTLVSMNRFSTLCG
jgi:hypothetical protein